MAQSVEQLAAERAVDKAITALLAAYNRECVEAGATPMNWVLVVESVTVNDDGDVDTEFTDLLCNHACRFPSAVGLLAIGAKQVEGG